MSSPTPTDEYIPLNEILKLLTGVEWNLAHGSAHDFVPDESNHPQMRFKDPHKAAHALHKILNESNHNIPLPKEVLYRDQDSPPICLVQRTHGLQLSVDENLILNFSTALADNCDLKRTQIAAIKNSNAEAFSTVPMAETFLEQATGLKWEVHYNNHTELGSLLSPVLPGMDTLVDLNAAKRAINTLARNAGLSTNSVKMSRWHDGMINSKDEGALYSVPVIPRTVIDAYVDSHPETIPNLRESFTTKPFTSMQLQR